MKRANVQPSGRLKLFIAKVVYEILQLRQGVLGDDRTMRRALMYTQYIHYIVLCTPLQQHHLGLLLFCVLVNNEINHAAGGYAEKRTLQDDDIIFVVDKKKLALV